MENTKSKKIIFIVLGILLMALLVIIFVILTPNAPQKEENINQVNEVEQKQLSKFSSAMKEDYKVAATMELPEAQEYLVNSVYENLDLYGETDGVEYIANSLLNEILNTTKTTAEDLIADVENIGTDLEKQILDGLLGTVPENVVIKNLTIKSNTVCNDEDIDDKFCVNKLNAEAYIVNENSDKWAVVVHPFMTSGSLMYRTVGYMYTEQGYNVLAPDLRGFGSSDGSVAMGYLESLDIYDWIKDLNNNYSKSDRYGVKVKPSTIIVHGISLGGATTVQLATNPDIAAAKGEPYTKTLTDLNVKGFIDDCGYTSMTGIITGMLSMGDITRLTSIFESLNIDKESFMTEFNKLVESLNIQGFEKFTIDNLKTLTEEEINSYFKEFSQIYSTVEEQLKQFENSNGQFEIPGYTKEDIDKILEYFESQDLSELEIPDFSNVDSLIPKPTTNVLGNTDTSKILNDIVGKALINLVGIGLNENNYDYYSNSFAQGRQFPTGAKVAIIHGTGDTTVPHSNADEIAAKINPAILVNKWDVPLAPHAFILLGMNKEEYKKLISDFTQCVENESCITINN